MNQSQIDEALELMKIKDPEGYERIMEVVRKFRTGLMDENKNDIINFGLENDMYKKVIHPEKIFIDVPPKENMCVCGAIGGKNHSSGCQYAPGYIEKKFLK